jgi:uncharacterized membrane protein YozB (DUF420 family)
MYNPLDCRPRPTLYHSIQRVKVANFMLQTSDLPTVNAILNGISAILLSIGYILIRTDKKRWQRHRLIMWSAFVMSILFLISYLIYHASIGGSKHYEGEGVLRIIYYVILFTHVVLAAIVPFLAIITLTRGQKKQFKQHRKIARITFPIWMYVSVTGVIVYLMLYVF